MKNRITNPEELKLRGKTLVAKKRKFPVHFTFSSNGQKNIRFSSNAKSINFTSSDSNQLGNVLEYVYLNSLSSLPDYAFNNAQQLTTVVMNPELEQIGQYCFNGCNNLESVEIPNNVACVNDYAFANCRALKIFGFEHYEYDSANNATPQLNSVNQNIISSSSNVKSITFPESITSLTQVDTNALAGSSVSSICFLGITSHVDGSRIKSSKCFSLDHDCTIISKDNCAFKFLKSTSTLESETYSQYGTASIANGKVNKLALGKKIYAFTEELYNWCVDPSQHDTSKIPSPAACPLIIIFADFKTSIISKQFLQVVLQNSNFIKWCKENLKCYLFLLDRNGHISQGESSDLAFFRNLPYFSGGEDKDFVHLSFIYDGNFNQTTFIPGSLQEFEDLLLEYASMTKFGDFDSTQYESLLDEPDPETIPTNGGDSTSIKTFHGSYPDWCSNGTVGSSTAWAIASSPMDFDLVSTPETSYLLIGAYDQNNPNSCPINAVNGMTTCFQNFADTVVVITNTECHSNFKTKFMLGKNYRFFMFYEFSHGGYQSITVGISYSDIWSMFSSLTTHQKVYGIFDSCHSGSMLQASKTAKLLKAEDSQQNILDYLEYKFARRNSLLASLFGTTSTARSVNPKMILHSTTSASNYGYYEPQSNTCFAKPYYTSYASNKDKRFNEFWTIIHSACYVSDSRGDAEPQQMVYPSESGSYYKNKIYF